MATKHVHTYRVAIRWGDMDANGHVNNTLYFRYMEDARLHWYGLLGILEGGPALPPGCGPIVVNSACNFIRALRYPGDVEIRLGIDQPGRSSVMTRYEMRPSYDPRVLYAEGSAKAIWVDRNRQKAIPLPEPVRRILAGDGE